MAEKIYIGGELESRATGNKVADVAHIKDGTKGNKSQAEINAETEEALAGRYTKEETYNKEELDSLITTPQVKYESVTATEQTTAVTDVLPATGEADTIYRVGSWDGAQYDATCYSEYAWKGDAYVHLSTKPRIGEVFDISAYHATGGELATYADLAAALDSNNGGGVPQSLQKGGMSVKFVQSSGKYVQFRLMADTFSTTVANWQGVDDEPEEGSDNLVNSKGVMDFLNLVLNYRYGDYSEYEVGIGGENALNRFYPFMVGHNYDIRNTGDSLIGLTIYNEDGTTISRNLQPSEKYNITIAKKAHKFSMVTSSASTGSTASITDNSNYLIDIANSLKGNGKTYQDTFNFNDAEVNSIHGLQGLTSVSHEPYTGFTDGILITFRYAKTAEDIGGQICIDINNNMYFRAYYGYYRAWKKLVSSSEITNLIQAVGYIPLNLTFTEGTYIDARNLNIVTAANWKTSNAFQLKRGQRIYISAQGYQNVTSILTRMNDATPVESVIASYGTGAYKQYIYDIVKDGTYKISGASGTSTPIIAFIGESVNAITQEPLDAILNVGVIGDSLASGTCNNIDKNGDVMGIIDKYDISWPQILKRKTGNTWYNFTKGGFSSYDWLNNSTYGYGAASQSDKKCQMYLLALGVNDAIRIRNYESGTTTTEHNFPLGTMADISDSDYTQNADSFYGWYARIIQQMRAILPKAKFVCFKIPNDAYSPTELFSRVNTAIVAIAEHFNCGIVDLSEYAQFEIYNTLLLTNKVSGHFNAITYQYISNIIYKALNDYICNNWKEYSYVEYINSPYEDLIPD